MPRGIPNAKLAPSAAPAPVVPEEPAPMIFIEPLADGSIRMNAYGLYAGEVVDALRRSLLHLVAQQSGIEIITLDVPARAAVVASRPAAPSKPKTAQPGRNGSKPAPRGSRVLVADHTDWEPDSDQ